MEADQTHILRLSANSEKSISELYHEVLYKPSDATRVELYIDVTEYVYNQRNKTKDQPIFLVSDILLSIFQNIPNLKELYVEGYEMYCKSKKYMVHTPSEYGLFCKFTEYMEEYVGTGQTHPMFESIEKMEFRKCCMNENDLKVLGSSIFSNLKKVYCFYCTPTDNETRHKYEDFLPNIDWDDKYYEDEQNEKNTFSFFKPLND